MSRTTRYKDTNSRWFGGNTTGRDRKPWNKPSSWFKTVRRRMRRKLEKRALFMGKELLPIFKRGDQWEWE